MLGCLLSFVLVCMIGNFSVASLPDNMGHNGPAEVMIYSPQPNKVRQTSPCTWTAPNGDFYDFTELARTGTEDDYMVSIPHSDFSLLINLCANALKVPARCASKAVSQASIGFQWNVKQPNSCWELGELSTAKFSYLDEQAPGKGIDIMYAGGTPCSTGVRMIHYHMICAGNDAAAQISAPSFAWESPTCHYHVVWPTVRAHLSYIMRIIVTHVKFSTTVIGSILLLRLDHRCHRSLFDSCRSTFFRLRLGRIDDTHRLCLLSGCGS